ncbi:MAG: hypothetical protein NZ922_03210 [Candidatus Methanomethyliaceae archaeon]|nr:hypothetical protein [Candidatus Methanomethyliaceae archaeon]MDW7970555.1 hypothetical protein [Nitrososphaerota archaeon]
MENEFEEISNAIISMLKDKGRLSYLELEEWAKRNDIGNITLRVILNSLIESEEIIAPEGYYENGSYFEPPIPKVIELVKSSPELEKLKDYLREYKSIGILRVFEDAIKMGVKNVNEVLKEAVKKGFAEITPSGVVNATEKLLKSNKNKNV